MLHPYPPHPTHPGECTWEEIVLFIFPQDNHRLNQNLTNVALLRNKLGRLLTDTHLPFDQWKLYLAALCTHFARKHQPARIGDMLDINGFYHLLCYLKIPVTGTHARTPPLSTPSGCYCIVSH